ncbi:putative Medium-chain acyl-coa dehydrogenase, partial [Daphnia magna]
HLCRNLLALRRTRRGLADQVGPHPRDPRGGQQGHRGCAKRRRRGRLLAGRGGPGRRSARPGPAAKPGRGSEVRLHHFGRQPLGCGSIERHGHPVGSPEMRALLALPRGRGCQPGPPDSVRPLRQQSARQRRNPYGGLNDGEQQQEKRRGRWQQAGPVAG